MFRLYVLGSGSAGNALLLDTGRTRVLVDCGFSGAELLRRMRAVGAGEPDTIDALVATHGHGDHVSGIPVVARRHGIPVYVTAGTERWLLRKGGFEMRRFDPGARFTIGDLEFSSIPLCHDAPDTVALVAAREGYRVGICSDLGHVTREVEVGLAGCDTLMLESNHDLDMVKNGPYPMKLKKRILGRYGHISNEECADLLRTLIPTGVKKVILSHLSENNNTPGHALAQMAPLRERHPAVEWSIAPQHNPAMMPLVGTPSHQLELL